METKTTTRVLALMDSVGLSQVKFANKCGISPSNFNRALKSEKGFSSQYLLRIAHAFDASFEWLRNGVGDMFADAYRKEKAIGEAQLAIVNKMLDAKSSPVSQNIISGDNYQGTQTINATEGEIVALRQKVELLKRLLDEKDKLLDEKDKLIKEKDKQIDLMYILINDKK